MSNNRSQYTTTFPYGKWKGRDLQAIPTDYLMFVLGEHDLRYGLREAVTEELRTRKVAGSKNNANSQEKHYVNLPKHVNAVMVAELIHSGKRALSLRHHPDLGGNLMAMQEVNAASDWLHEVLDEVFAQAEVW